MMRTRAFTLTEVLIVVAIIGLLAGMAIPGVIGMRTSATVAKAKGELVALQSAVESYRVHTGAYPANLGVLTTAVPNIIGAALPTDPFTSSSAYGYARSGNYYVIYSVGRTGGGSASVNASGTVTKSGTPNYVTNGTPQDTA